MKQMKFIEENKQNWMLENTKDKLSVFDVEMKEYDYIPMLDETYAVLSYDDNEFIYCLETSALQNFYFESVNVNVLIALTAIINDAEKTWEANRIIEESEWYNENKKR